VLRLRSGLPHDFLMMPVVVHTLSYLPSSGCAPGVRPEAGVCLRGLPVSAERLPSPFIHPGPEPSALILDRGGLRRGRFV